MSELVATFNLYAGSVEGAKLADVLRCYPDAVLEYGDGWLEVRSDSLPTDHPINILSDVVMTAWEKGAILDSRFNQASSAIESLRTRERERAL